MAASVPLIYADLGAPLAPVAFACVARPLPPAEMERWFQFASTVGYTVPRLSGDIASLRDPARAIRATKPFSLMPRDVLGGPDDWISLRRGRWTQADHITLGEGRALLSGLDICSARACCHRTRILSLQDNQAIAGSFTKGRSPSPALNFLARRKCSRVRAGQIFLSLPWVHSDAMPADRDSRLL